MPVGEISEEVGEEGRSMTMVDCIHGGGNKCQ